MANRAKSLQLNLRKFTNDVMSANIEFHVDMFEFRKIQQTEGLGMSLMMSLERQSACRETTKSQSHDVIYKYPMF